MPGKKGKEAGEKMGTRRKRSERRKKGLRTKKEPGWVCE